MMKTNNISLYIHFPFCKKRCSYCDFYSTTNLERIGEYESVVLNELLLREDLLQGKNIDSIFFGGGTPSLSSVNFVREFLSNVSRFSKLDGAEITVEMNPESAGKEYIAELKRSGVNRISFGLQSTHDEILNLLGRIHSYKDFLCAYKNARNAGFDNINIDMISSVPNLTEKMLMADADRIIELSPEHISWYSLILEDGTRLCNQVNNGEYRMLSEDVDRQMVHMIEEKLRVNGYEQYELSNFSKAGYRCRHNMRYWRIEDYLGFGAAAASSVGDLRFQNEASLENYMLRINRGEVDVECETVNIEQRLLEYIIMGLRLNDGLIFNDIRDKYGVDFRVRFAEPIEKMVKSGLIIDYSERIVLTPYGRDLANLVELEFYSYEG